MADQINPAIDAITARNSTKVYLLVNGQRVGRVQSFSEDQANNVQVLTELGRDVAVELKKGITIYQFQIAKFWCRNDVFANLKGGNPFSLMVRDTAGVRTDGSGRAGAQVLENFKTCMIQSISTSIQTGQATIAQNAQVVTIGRGQAV